MAKTELNDAMLYQAMERAWLIMAFISIALSDHPVVKSSKSYRRCTDRARKALFDLHKRLEAAFFGNYAMSHASSHLKTGDLGRGEPTEDDFGRRLLRRKGSVPESVQLGFDSDDPGNAGRRRAARKR